MSGKEWAISFALYKKQKTSVLSIHRQCSKEIIPHDCTEQITSVWSTGDLQSFVCSWLNPYGYVDKSGRTSYPTIKSHALLGLKLCHKDQKNLHSFGVCFSPFSLPQNPTPLRFTLSDSSSRPQLCSPAHFLNRTCSTTREQGNRLQLQWFSSGACWHCLHNADVCPQSRWNFTSNVESPFQIRPCPPLTSVPFCFITRKKDPA